MKLKDTKGSITIFVLVGLLFMASFLMISYGYNVNKSKIAKQQFNSISDIYMPNKNMIDSYTEAYTYLRSENKQSLTYNSENEGLTSVSEIELEKTYADKISNYIIYGNTLGVGNQITDTTDNNYGKYKIVIQITSREERSSTYSIYLSEKLQQYDFIDYKNQKIVRQVSGQIEEETIYLPEIYSYEDYTKIEIISDYEPSKIEVKYTGYKFE